MSSFPHGWDEERLRRLAGEIHETACRPTREGYLSRWLHGPKYTDIFVDIAPGGDLASVEISFGGHFLRWDGEHLSTGQTDEMRVSDGMPQARLVRPHTHVDSAIAHAARALIEHLPDKILADLILKSLPPS